MGNFTKVMQQKSDEELTQILLVERNDFNQIAILDAIEVAKERNISIDYDEILKSYLEVGKNNTITVNRLFRFLHLIVDSIIVFIITAIILFLIYTVTEGNGLIYPVIGVIYILVRFLYYYKFENKYNRTIGKFITRTKVVDINGDKPDHSAILARTICRFIPFDYVSFLGKGWHDSLSETKVVKNKHANNELIDDSLI